MPPVSLHAPISLKPVVCPPPAPCVQNEPEPQTGTETYEGLCFPSPRELEFVAEYLGPQLARDHPGTRILVFDHNQARSIRGWHSAPLLALTPTHRPLTAEGGGLLRDAHPLRPRRLDFRRRHGLPLVLGARLGAAGRAARPLPGQAAPGDRCVGR